MPYIKIDFFCLFFFLNGFFRKCFQTGEGGGAAELRQILQHHGHDIICAAEVKHSLVLLACYHNSIRVHSYLLRAALVPPSLSPWHKLYDEGDSSSFLHVTGLTREAFDSLLYVVIPPGHTMRFSIVLDFWTAANSKRTTVGDHRVLNSKCPKR